MFKFATGKKLTFDNQKLFNKNYSLKKVFKFPKDLVIIERIMTCNLGNCCTYKLGVCGL